MEKPHYKNWIPFKLVAAVLLGAMALLLIARLLVERNAVAGLLLMLLAFAALFLGLYILRARTALDDDGGGVQGKVLDGVLHHLARTGWNGRGKALDIGCGSGSADRENWPRRTPAHTSSASTSGAGGVGVQPKTLRGQRPHRRRWRPRLLSPWGTRRSCPSWDGVFDAAVSNFVFHEVRAQPDKRALILEALRVLRPGGAFAFRIRSSTAMCTATRRNSSSPCVRT